MKKIRIQPFLYRAFHSSGFRLSFVLGLFLAVLQIVQMRTPIDSGYIYPASLYAMWVGGEWASYASSLLFLLLPLIATLPFSDCVARDKKTGYIYHLLLHQERNTVFLECALTAFISGFSAAILPFLENFLLCATLYPALPPQASTYTFSPSLHGFLVNVFYTRPLLYCLVYILLIGVFFGALAVLGMSLGFFLKSPIFVHLLVFALYFWVYYITMQLGWYSLNPYVFLNPTQTIVFPMTVYLVYVIGMLVTAALVIFAGGRRYEAVS